MFAEHQGSPFCIFRRTIGISLLSITGSLSKPVLQHVATCKFFVNFAIGRGRHGGLPFNPGQLRRDWEDNQGNHAGIGG
ncbi:MAG: hypothetical protein HC769_35055 [Cyanobacteria bacterium CRU_2_1]|nr:hypothetical protein [Cyanobacteria bacterium CRU_2_1]